MKKRIFAIVIAIVLLCSACLLVYGTDDGDELRLFGMKGEEYIARDPNSGEDAEDWNTLLGKDNFINSDKGVYPLEIEKRSDETASYYYIAGSNDIEGVLIYKPEYIDYLHNDFVIEYDINYSEAGGGRISVVHAFNYTYYIDAYISPDGSGDIVAVSEDGCASLLDESSMLDPNDGKELVSALYGEDASDLVGGYVNIAVRVSVNGDGMPCEIAVFVNGMKVGTADTDKLADFVGAHTPEYEIKAGETFPTDTLGNIVALKCTPDTKCELDNIRIYSVDSADLTPTDGAMGKYAEVYGNDLYFEGGVGDESSTDEDVTDEDITDEDVTDENITEEDASEEPSEDVGENNTDDTESDIEGSDDVSSDANGETETEEDSEGEGLPSDTEDLPSDGDGLNFDALIVLVAVLGGATVLLVVLAAVIIKKRS